MTGDRLAYVASQRLRPEDVEAVLELRRTTGGALGVLAYSSVELLVQGCGPEQPWVAVPAERVEDLVGLSGAHTVLWDVEIPLDQRHTAGGRP